MCSLCTIVCSATALTSQRTQTVAFGSQVVTRMGYYVQGDKIKLQLNIFYGVSMLAVLCTGR